MVSDSQRVIKGAIIGTGYFAEIQMQAWQKIENAEIVSVCDLDIDKANSFAEKYGITTVYGDFFELLEASAQDLDFIDIVTRPDSHVELVRKAAVYDVAILCQKPLAPTFKESLEISKIVKDSGCTFMVNENWRWQTWYREIKGLLEQGIIGDVWHVAFKMRTADGRGTFPYSHQPYFKDMERLLVFETLVHYVDTLRFFLGEITEVYSVLKTINSNIAGEDYALITLGFENGATAIIDANRFAESEIKNEAFGTCSLEGNEGSIMLRPNLDIHVLKNTGDAYTHNYKLPIAEPNYKGASCYNTQKHFIEHLVDGNFESTVLDYSKTLAVVEAIYESAKVRQVVQPSYVN